VDEDEEEEDADGEFEVDEPKEVAWIVGVVSRPLVAGEVLEVLAYSVDKAQGH